MTPTAAQKSLWGRQKPLPAPRKTGTATNDVELITSIIRSATDPGYVVIGPAERVFLRDPADKSVVAVVAKHEADTVSQLLGAGHLKVGSGVHHVTYGDRNGPAHSVLVPKATRDMAARWSDRPPGTPRHQRPPEPQPLRRARSTRRPRPTPRATPTGLWCPECGDPVRRRPPSTWDQADGPRPGYSHTNGEPPCIVIDSDGEGPIPPVTSPPNR